MNSSQKFFFEIPKYGWEGTWDCWLMFLAAYSRIFWRYIDWLCEHFFLKCWNSDFLKNSSLIGKVKFQKFFMTLLPKKSILCFFLKQLPYWLVVRFQGVVVVQLFLSKVGPLFKEPVVFGRPPTSSFDVNTFKSCLTCVESSFFKFWVFSQLENLLRRRGKDGIYALPHNLSKKFLYGMKPSSSSLSASSSRSLRTSSLGISSPNMIRKFSSSANIMVPFSFLS